MRFLFASTRGAAHIAPLVPFALACKRAGHDVLLAAPHSSWEHVARAGLPFAGFDFPAEAEIGPIWARVKASTDPDEQNRIVRGELFAGAYAREAYPGLLALARRMRPDAILHETEEHASPRVAEVLGTPVWRVECYLGPAVPESGPFLTLSPASFDPRPGAVRFRARVRPEPPLPDWWRGSDAPLVYVSFGSTAAGNGFFPGLYRAAASALAELDVRVLMTLGTEVDASELGPVPANVHVERWVPQAQVMPEAAAMVGHGGSASTLAAMAAGVPLACVPLYADQPDNAARVAALGAGIALDGVDGLADAVRALLGDPLYRDGARRIAREIASHALVDDVSWFLRAEGLAA
ncbi:glycosyltransferase family 1 protein [Solirubrobacter sp. CPCC 204708]|uniref:Glycosyltransferase n=1 Tax=Solirubrobacter deserti TaxID=2282478 RepID=A0ABT4RHZ7_9ACTN|nr:glycosyltransferase [Solirubrobacter deserti]MBE2315236.1 glycosyltransferase family 1 protein [Solirubrobacter deserti]MDA0137920.1 glycosyltransferase [Solirubrobacter deserti]